MNGFDLIARCLKAEGVEWMACFPNNPLIESCAKIDIRPIVFRQERGGINAIDGYARQTAGKKIGIFASQSGPGVENSFGGIAQAWGEGVPIIFLPGGSGLRSYDVKPNFSAIKNYGEVTKAALSIDHPGRTTMQMQRAFPRRAPRSAGAGAGGDARRRFAPRGEGGGRGRLSGDPLHPHTPPAEATSRTR